MSELRFKVYCNQGRFWECIAAFNCESAAKAYAEQCAESADRGGLPFAYIVKKGHLQLWGYNMEKVA